MFSPDLSQYRGQRYRPSLYPVVTKKEWLELRPTLRQEQNKHLTVTDKEVEERHRNHHQTHRRAKKTTKLDFFQSHHR